MKLVVGESARLYRDDRVREDESVLNKNEVETLSDGIYTSRLISRLIDGRVLAREIMWPESLI